MKEKKCMSTYVLGIILIVISVSFHTAFAQTSYKNGVDCIYDDSSNSYVSSSDTIVKNSSYSLKTSVFDSDLDERICKSVKEAYYKINYYANDGSGRIIQSDNLEYGVTYNLPKDVFTRTGYTLSRWCDSYDCGEMFYSTSIAGKCGYQGCEIDLWAGWDANDVTYNIEHRSNTGKLLGSDTITKKYGTTNTILSSSFSGYNSPSSQTVTWDSVDAKTIVFTYTPISYSISYNLDGGSIGGHWGSYNIESPNYNLPTPTKVGYTFKGWTGSNGSTPQTSVTVYSGSTGNLSYTANWQENGLSYNMVFNTTDAWATFTAPSDGVYVALSARIRAKVYINTSGTTLDYRQWDNWEWVSGRIVYLTAGQTITFSPNGNVNTGISTGVNRVIKVKDNYDSNVRFVDVSYKADGYTGISGTSNNSGVLFTMSMGYNTHSHGMALGGASVTGDSTNSGAVNVSTIKIPPQTSYSASANTYNYGRAFVGSVFN